MTTKNKIDITSRLLELGIKGHDLTTKADNLKILERVIREHGDYTTPSRYHADTNKINQRLRLVSGYQRGTEWYVGLLSNAVANICTRLRRESNGNGNGHGKIEEDVYKPS